MSSPLYQEETVGIKVPEESTSQGPTEPGVTSETVGVKVPEESTTQVPTEPGIPADTQILKGILTIGDMEFSDDLSKPSSKAFKTLADDLTKLLDRIFQPITGFLYTKVDSFDKGSIVCKFSIFTKAGSSSAEDYKTALVAASKDGKTEKFKIDKIEVYEKEPEIPTDAQIWKASLTIVDMEFSDDLSKSSSKAFKTLAGDLTKLLDGIFQSITGFLYTKVDSFEKGSIVCKFSIFTKAGSSSAKDYKTALVAASKEGKTGKFKMEKIEVYKTESVGTFKGEKSQKVFQPLKVIGITIFVTAVVMVVLFLVVKVSSLVSIYPSIFLTTRLKEGRGLATQSTVPHLPLDLPLSGCITSLG